MIIKYIPNPFDKATTEFIEVLYAAVTISELTEGYLEIDLKYNVPIVNGAVVSWDFIPAKDDDVIITVDISGGNGFAGGLMVTAGVIVGVTTGWTGFGAPIAAGLISAGAGLLVGSLITQKKSIPKISSELESSATYSFNGIENRTGEGHVIPLVYGRHRVGGVILEANVDNFDGNVSPKQLLSITTALSEGEIGGIVNCDEKKEIYINDQPLGQLGENCLWHSMSIGASKQPPLKVNSVKENSYHLNIKLNDSTDCYYNVKTYQTYAFDLFIKTTATDIFNVFGLYQGSWIVLHAEIISRENDNITLRAFTNNKEIKQLKLSIKGGITLVRVVEHVGIVKNLSQIRHYYAIQGVKLTHKASYIYKLNNNEISSVRIAVSLPCLYHTQGSNINAHTVTFRVYTSGTSNNWSNSYVEKSITDKSRSTLSFDMDIPLSTRVEYIKIERVTPDSKGFDIADDTYLKSITESEDVAIQYNNTAVLGIKVEPTDRLSGALPNVTAVIDGIKICSVIKIYELQDHTKYINNPTGANPADIIYDILTNTRYGLGKYLSQGQIHMDSLYDFACWCDEIITYQSYDSTKGQTVDIKRPRYRLNLVIDTEMTAVEILSLICKSSRCLIYWQGDKLRITIDRPKKPSQLFGMGNIVKDSYAETYISLKDTPNQIEARFLDAQQNYKQRTVSAFDSSRTDEPVYSKTIELYGVTDFSQVKVELIYALKKARAIRRFITFATGIEGVVAEIGDVILFSHDTPQYGFSGRVSDIKGSEIILDREVPLSAGVRYRVLFGTGNDIFAHEWVAQYNTCNSIAVPDHKIKINTPYTLGILKKEAIPLRIFNMRHTNNFTVELECEEYNESVYDTDEFDIIDMPDYSSLGVSGSWVVDGNNILPSPDNPVAGMADIPSAVEGIILTETVTENYSGGLTISIRVDWERSEIPHGSLSAVDYYAVMVSTENDKWSIAGSTKATTYFLHDVNINTPIKIAVKPYTMYGVTNNNYNVVDITPTGEVPLPDAPNINFALQNGKYIKIGWDSVTNTIIKHYEIRVGDDWSFARKIGTTSSCEFSSQFVVAGKVTYQIAAVNINGKYGKPTGCLVDIYDITKNVVYECDSKALQWDGIYHNMKLTNNELEAISTSASYTTGYIDLLEPVKANVTVDYDIAGYHVSKTPIQKMDKHWADYNLAWQPRAKGDSIEHAHYISYFTNISDDFIDIIRLAGDTESIRGMRPIVNNNIMYGYGTFHKGVKRGSLSTKLEYDIKLPDEWSICFRYSYKGKISTGVIVTLGVAYIAYVGNGEYRFINNNQSISINVLHDERAELLFCVSYVNGDVFFGVGDINTGALDTSSAHMYLSIDKIKI